MSATIIEREATETQLVAFQLAGETYGVDISLIHEIILMTDITYIPRASQGIRGIINLRGKIVPVLELRTRLGLPEAEPTRATRIIVIEQNDCTVGMVVDSVVGVLRLSEAQIEPPSQLVTALDTELIRGVGKEGDSLVILLDIPHVLRIAA